MRDLNPVACKIIDLVMVAMLAGFAVHFYHTENKIIPEIYHAMCASHGEKPKPQEHGR